MRIFPTGESDWAPSTSVDQFLKYDGSVSSSWKIGIVTARFNSKITKKLEEGVLRLLHSRDVKSNQITVVHVPGAVEVPLACAHLLDQGCHGVIALATVIRGETAHFDYVCSSVERGCTELQLVTRRPVVFGVLTVDNEDQALARVGGTAGHKGEEAAETVLEMIWLSNELKGFKSDGKENRRL